jgi:hypothetical protein
MSYPNDYDRGELFYKEDGGAGFPTAFFTPSSWTGGAIKLKFFDFDHSNLKWHFIGDSAVQNAFEGHPPPHKTYRYGSFKFKMWLEGGSDTITAGTLAVLIGHILGGIKSPAAITDAVEAAATATNITATAHGMDENDLVLVGVRGDSGGDGRLVAIEDATSSADDYDVQIALPAAPAASDVLKNGHQVWVDWTDESYLDFLFIGSDPGSGGTDDPWQIQMIGCQAKITIGGLGLDEKPFVEFEVFVGDWQFVADADKATLDPTAAANGDDPVDGQQSGSLLLQDAGTTTRQTVSGDEYSVSWGYDLMMVKDLNNNNRCGGWKKVRAEAPMIGFKSYWSALADMPGLYNDSINDTAKQVLLQLGHVAESTVGFYMQNATMDRPIDPSSVQPIDQQTALALNFRGSTGGATDLATDAKKQEDAAMIMTFN